MKWTISLPCSFNRLFQKKSKQGRLRNEISRVTEKIERGNSRGQTKAKWNFQGWLRKIYVEFSGVLVFGLEIPRCVRLFCWIPKVKLYVSGICKGKVANLNFSGFLFKKMSSAYAVWVFSGTANEDLGWTTTKLKVPYNNILEQFFVVFFWLLWTFLEACNLTWKSVM